MTIPLAALEVLAIDCQATGANPHQGHLLEIGWTKVCASALENPADLNVETYLVALPGAVEIPRPVERVTGISTDAMSAAIPAENVWHRLSACAMKIAAADHTPLCPAVIHYSRFEEPFLKALHRKYERHNAFPFMPICTHQIARRLLPGLPRKGIRAIAGYFGHSLTPRRRSAAHAIATAVIWKNLLERLRNACGICELGQLLDWLASNPPPSRYGRRFPMDKKKRLALPDEPGVYRLLRANGDLLYVGKATSLKKRVNSYFGRSGVKSEHTLEMLSQAYDLNVTVTGSALEAAVFESDEIKRHDPPYNVALRGGQRRLVFCSKDLHDSRAAANDRYSIGPLPEGTLLEAMSAFSHWIAEKHHDPGSLQSPVKPAILALPIEYAPDTACLEEGVLTFYQRHRSLLARHSPLRALTGLGARLRHERLEAEPDTAITPEDPEDGAPGSAVITPASKHQPLWTPENVARALESVISRSAHLIRRSRWFCLLSESSLSWESRIAGNHRRLVIVFEGGRILQRQNLASGQEIPIPPGFANTFRTRQQSFDLMIYDRMRVVTTELRRLIADRHKVELRLGPKTILRHPQLAKLLQWI